MKNVKKGMLLSLPIDLWSVLIQFISFEEVCRCRETCVHTWNILCQLEWDVAVQMSVTVFDDASFWPRAYRRPPETSRGLDTWHAEVVRLWFYLQRCPSTTAKTLYHFWSLIDGVDATVGQAPPPPPLLPPPPPRPCPRPCPCRR